jgi:hypothetical protein
MYGQWPFIINSSLRAMSTDLISRSWQSNLHEDRDENCSSTLILYRSAKNFLQRVFVHLQPVSSPISRTLLLNLLVSLWWDLWKLRSETPPLSLSFTPQTEMCQFESMNANVFFCTSLVWMHKTVVCPSTSFTSDISQLIQIKLSISCKVM